MCCSRPSIKQRKHIHLSRHSILEYMLTLNRSGCAMAVEEVLDRNDGFYSGVPDSEWYKNLERRGSCLKLLSLLEKEGSLIHKLGPEDITVLHKGVEHGCVVLVRFILVDMFDDEGLCKCSLHDRGSDVAVHGVGNLTREQLLRKTNSHGSSAVNIAVVSGNPKMVTLLKWAIEMSRGMSGGSTTKMSSEIERETLRLSRYFSEKECGKEIQEESVNRMVNELVLPDVRDEDINILESSNCAMAKNVISVIENILEDPGEDIDKELLDMMKERCQRDVDFEFVPIAHVFPHFFLSVETPNLDPRWDSEFLEFRNAVMRKIFETCKYTHDGEEETSGLMLQTLFNILDPRGRPLFHALLESDNGFPSLHNVLEDSDISRTIISKCFNAKDGVGRTILHVLFIHRRELVDDELMVYLDLNISLFSSQSEQLNVLKEWCFPSMGRNIWRFNFKPIQYAILFNSDHEHFWPSNGNICYEDSLEEDSIPPLQLAAMLGRTRILESILNHHRKFNSSYDRGLGNARKSKIAQTFPAIHLAAMFGQVEAIQSILKFRVYDPIIQHFFLGTALHHILNKTNIRHFFDDLPDFLLHHILPNSDTYKRLENDIRKLELDGDIKPRMYSANEISCINLLLQAGIDIWTPHCDTKEFPSPGPMANDEARKWWYEKVVNEVVTLKTSISGAANATSVIAALVATASFIGPFQPPLGYGDTNYVQTDRSPIRVYLVCNSLSFFFSIASILMAVLPAIPMPKESLYDELLRSQRCLKGGALMLLISIICILISFSSASLSVVSSEWQERELVVACVICGGVICLGVLAIYIIRLLRMVYHRHDWFRRNFSKYMYF